MTKSRWPLTGALFVWLSVLWTALAWGGDNFSLVMLCLTSIFLAVMMAYNGASWRRALDGWNRSNDGWEKALDYLKGGR